MKIALFSDAHGNALALQQLFNEPAFRRADRHFFLGDAVGYFPDGAAVLRMLERQAVFCLQGNHDAMAAGLLPLDPKQDEVYQLGAQRSRLRPEDVQLLGHRSPEAVLEVDGGRALLVHGSPADPLEGRLYPDTALDGLVPEGCRYVFCGHTHRPFLRSAGGATVVNTGSVGLPRDIGNRAAYAVWDTGADAVELHYFALDTAAMLRAYPQVHPAVRDCLRRGA